MNWLLYEKLMQFIDTIQAVSWTSFQSAIAFIKGYVDYTSNIVSPILKVGEGFAILINQLPRGIWVMLVMLMVFTIVFTAVRIVIDLL